MTTYDVSTTAQLQAQSLGLGDDLAELADLLAGFARHSAIITHELGNRRFGGYVLDMHEGRIYGIDTVYEADTVCKDSYGTGIHRMTEGDSWVEVPCQSCKEG
jgi:hypothetical protein